MCRTTFASLAGLLLVTISTVTAQKPADVATLKSLSKKLEPLHTPLGKPQPGDWLVDHPETGQTFAEYLTCQPVVPQGKRSVLYIQPLGKFTATQRKIVTQTADYLGRFYNLTVKVNADLDDSVIPDKARRKHPTWGMDQILSTYVLHQVLTPRLPNDAAALIAFTATDLWPGEGWNFVFGQASLRDRVGVWSLNRNGNPDQNDDAYRLCLVRTLKTASHETGHMFSIKHCTKYECNMCGSNNLTEADRQPLEVCPECVAKICWATNADPGKRYEKLTEFCEANGLKSEQERFEKLRQAIAK